MQNMLCLSCGSQELNTKEIEIRHINSITMTIASWEKVIELECRYCGWVGSVAPMAAVT
jgi:hypothetical protein